MTELEQMLGDRKIYTDAPVMPYTYMPPVAPGPPPITLSGEGTMQGHRNNFGSVQGQAEVPIPSIPGSLQPWMTLQGQAQLGNYQQPQLGGGGQVGVRYEF